MKSQIKLVVGIATRGRAALLSEALTLLAKQEREPDQTVVAYAEPSDVEDAPRQFPHVTFIRTPLGLTRQRNAILNWAAESDLLLFIDDDFFPDPQYLTITEEYFVNTPNVVAATGTVLAEDIKGPGLTVAYAKSIVGSSDAARGEQQITPLFFVYGCNMCLRMAPIRTHQLRFDETLPLYGDYEDWDFSRQLANYGSIVRISNACGVHLSAKIGRMSGVRTGYSQVANPIYLARKGTFPWSHVFKVIAGPCLKNMVRSVAPEAYVDRLGRFCGNMVAFRDLLLGRLNPKQIIDL
jgi:GT2 family glycosyltransferase